MYQVIRMNNVKQSFMLMGEFDSLPEAKTAADTQASQAVRFGGDFHLTGVRELSHLLNNPYSGTGRWADYGLVCDADIKKNDWAKRNGAPLSFVVFEGTWFTDTAEEIKGESEAEREAMDEQIRYLER